MGKIAKARSSNPSLSAIRQGKSWAKTRTKPFFPLSYPQSHRRWRHGHAMLGKDRSKEFALLALNLWELCTWQTCHKILI
jgi:hypothetical protein